MKTISFFNKANKPSAPRLVFAVVIVLLLLANIFPVAPGSTAGTRSDRDGRDIRTFYLRGSSQLSHENPTSNTPQRISISRATLGNQWSQVGVWSYSVPEYRAEVKGEVSVTYTLLNTRIIPVATMQLNFTLKGSGAQIMNHTISLRGLSGLRTRTGTATFDISPTYIMQNSALELEISAQTFSNDIEFLYDSVLYDSALEIDYSDANYPPLADAGSDISIREGEVADLVGTGVDTDGYITQYEWDFESDGNYDWASALGGRTSHRYIDPGFFTASLRVTDDDGAVTVDSCTVSVQENKPPTVTITNPTDGQEVNSTVAISGTAVDEDEGDRIDSVWIKFDSGQWHRAVGTNNWLLNWDTTLESNGVHMISAKANDSLDESAVQSLQVTVNNVGINPKPTCSILSILPNPAFKLDNVEFMGQGNDDGTIVEWSWTSSIGAQLSNKQNFTMNSLMPGNHTIYLRVKDNNGSWSNSDSRLLMIKEFSRPKQITSHQSTDVESSTIFDDYGVFWCAWSTSRDGNWNIYLKSSVDGVDWSAPIRISDEPSTEREASLVQLDNLTYAVAYSSDAGGNFDIYVRYSQWGGYWTPPVRVSNSPYDEREPCIYQRADGKIFVAYSIDEPAPVGTSIRIVHGNSLSSLSQPVTATTGQSNNKQPSLVEGANQNISVLFSSDRTGNFEIWQTVFMGLANFSTASRITYTVKDNYFPSVMQDSTSIYRLVYSDDTDTLHLSDSADLIHYSEPKVVPTDFQNNNDPSIFQDAQGGFWVTWDSTEPGNKDVYALSFSGNSPPQAVISSPEDGENYFTSDSIRFDGSASGDPNGNEELDGFVWRSDKSGQLSTQPVFSRNLLAGMHNITLTVSDIHGASSTAEVTVVVTLTPNEGPTANASVSKTTAKVNEEVTFDASGSYDPDGDSLSYSWDFESDGVWDDFNETPKHSFDTAGTYEATLMVEDPSAANDTDTISITITENLIPKARIKVDFNKINVNTTVQFYGNDSSDDDGDMLYFAWDFNGDGEVDSQSMTPTYKFTKRGEYTVNLTVSDPFGGNDTDDVLITVNKPPVAVLIGASAGYVDEPMTFFAGNSSDEDGDELEYKWDFESDGEIDAVAEESEHTYEEAGEYTVILWVLDDRNGVDSTELDVLISVRNIPPISEAGEDLQGNIKDDIKFDSSGSFDPDDDIDGNGVIDGDEVDNLTYSWDMGDGKMKTGAAPVHTYKEAGEYTVTLKVTDADGASANDTLTVNINTPPEAHITLINTGEIKEGTEVVLTAVESSDEDVDEDGDEDELEFSWDFDESDGISEEETGEEVIHVYDLEGLYVVTLTVDDGNGGNDTTTLEVMVLKADDGGVKLDTPSIEITSPARGKKFDYKTKTVDVTVAAEGDFIQRVVITFYKGPNEVNTQEFTDDFDDIMTSFSIKSKGDYEIFAQIFNDDHPSYTAYDSVNISRKSPPASQPAPKVEKEKGIQFIKFLPEGPLYQYGFIGLVLIIVVSLIVVIKKKKRGKGGEKLEDGSVEVDAEEVAEVIEVEEEEDEDIPIEELIEPLTQPILCPKCNETFEVKDYGERPLAMKCPHCGATGTITTTVPEILEKRKDWALTERKRKKAAPVIKEKLLPAKSATEIIDEGVKIRCPKCNKGFTTKTRKNITCPHCGARGDVPAAEFEKLKKRQQPAEPKRLPPAPADAGRKKTVTKVSKKEILDKLSGSAEKVECPKCTASFFVEKDAKRIKCPSCGVKGKMG